MENFINNLIENRLNQVNTILPAKILNVGQRTVALKILFYKETADGQKVEYPNPEGVPVLNLKASGVNIQVPVKKGDEGLYFVCQRDISKIVDGETVIDTTRKFDISDGLFLPVDFSQSSNLKNENLVLENGKSKIELEKTGKIEVSGLSNLIDELINLTTIFIKNSSSFGNFIDPQSGAPVPVNTAALNPDFVKIKSKLEALKL